MSRTKRRHRPPGQELEHRVSEALKNLGIDHDHFPTGSEEDADHKIDFRLYDGTRPPMDFQLTLFTNARDKIRSFVAAALTHTENRGARVYLEVNAARALWWQVRDGRRIIASMVAKAMKEIFFSYGNFEEGNLLGVRLTVSKRHRFLNLDRFSLLWEVGTDWLRSLKKWLDRKQLKEAARQARETAAAFMKEMAERKSRAASWRVFAQHDFRHDIYGQKGVPRLAFVPARTDFVPRRFP